MKLSDECIQNRLFTIFCKTKNGNFVPAIQVCTLAGPTDILPARAGMPAHFAKSEGRTNRPPPPPTSGLNPCLIFA